MKICFIGFGNMAKALAEGFMGDNLTIFATSPSLKAEILQNGIITDSNNIAFIDQVDLIILAVKPAKAASVLQQITPFLPKNIPLLSIAAGLNLAWLAKHLNPNQPIIRCMPNTPVAVKLGATPFIANAHVTLQQKNQLTHLFEKISLVTWLDKEQDMNALTALSGSGPAYVFLFIEALIKAGQAQGLSKEVAEEFSLQTVLGAATLLKESALSAEELRAKVTSKGGTTEAAIAVLQGDQFEAIIADAIKAAVKKAEAL